MKVRCPFPEHEDTNPSAYKYGNKIYCFVCNKGLALKEERGVYEKTELKKQKVSEYDISRIQSLPITNYRCLDLHSDGKFVYIIYPDGQYYRARNIHSNCSASKYVSPKGVVKHYMYLPCENTDTLLLVEGEINALSIRKVNSKVSLLCPGSATDFSTATKKYQNEIKRFKKVIVTADKDTAGAKAVINALKVLRHLGVGLRHHLWTKDANDLLIEGEEYLEREVKRILEL